MLFLAPEIVWPVNVNPAQQKSKCKQNWNRLIQTIMTYFLMNYHLITTLDLLFQYLINNLVNR